MKKNFNLNRQPTIWYLAFFVVPVIIIIIGIVLVYGSSKNKEVCTAHTTGYLLDYDWVYDSDNSSYRYYGIYKYEVNGKTYTLRHSTGHTSKRQVDDEIPIMYNPNNPKQVYEKGVSFTGYAFIVFGIAFCICIIKSIIGGSRKLYRKQTKQL